jgi:hypothetical protein
MSKVRFMHGGDGRRMLRFNCPGCEHPHVVILTGHRWFNDDTERPTLTPSIVVRARATDQSDPDAVACESTCHSFVTDGRIQFLGDCTHKLAGQTVDLPELP